LFLVVRPGVTRAFQIGVTSFGISFGCEIGWPAVFTRVTEYLDWIAENSDVEIN
jgi:secreted trypsin-like serine protease